MAVIASALATLLHEGVGHGLAAFVRGDVPTELTSNHLSCRHSTRIARLHRAFRRRGHHEPQVSFASHGSDSSWTGRGRGHPRTSGTFSRVLGRYVREQRVLPLMEALRKMTLMPAQRLAARVPAMRNKGRIREGADADIIVFDADRIIDRATFQAQRPSEGMRFVLVNGVLVVRDGVIQEGVFAGRPVRAPTSNTQRWE
jgi:dihydroorotase